MGGEKRKRRAPSATPWDGVPAGQAGPAQELVRAAHGGAYAFRHERFAGDADFFNGYPLEACPRCGGPLAGAGLNRSGVRRWRCKACGRVSTPVTGTIFDNSKLPATAWADFVLQALSFESLAAITREDRRSGTTTPYWMAKLFAVLEGVQDGVVLSGRVWVDETFWPVAPRDAVLGPDGRKVGGLSRNQICIGVGVDDSGRALLVREGLGKPSKAMTWAAFGDRIEAGSTLVHDLDRSHPVLVERLGLASEAYNAKLLKGVPDALNPLEPVNRACFLLKTLLRAHPGFDRGRLQGYLDLLSVALNPPADRLEKVALVLDRAMRCPKTLRFREFYNVSPRSGE